MADRILPVGEGFWNIRGSFKIAGVIDIGTQASLVRLQAGGFALLDSYTLTGEVERRVMDLTDGGRAVRAVLNLHPFHTIHVERTIARFPDAAHYGTARHLARAPDAPWQALRCEDPELHDLFADDLRFSVPRGVDFISPDPNLHFSSVLALHRSSRTLHVDDTLTWVGLPVVGGLSFHPTLAKVLERRPGAVADFRSWADELVALCADVDHLCTAHTRPLPPVPPEGAPVADQVRAALAKVEKVLVRHEKRFG